MTQYDIDHSLDADDATTPGRREPRREVPHRGGNAVPADRSGRRAVQYDLSRVEAYMLCSVLVDLKINEVVNVPNWVVSAHVPEGPLSPARIEAS